MSFKSWIYRPENRVRFSGQGDNFITKAVRKISTISLVIVFFLSDSILNLSLKATLFAIAATYCTKRLTVVFLSREFRLSYGQEMS